MKMTIEGAIAVMLKRIGGKIITVTMILMMTMLTMTTTTTMTPPHEDDY